MDTSADDDDDDDAPYCNMSTFDILCTIHAGG